MKGSGATICVMTTAHISTKMQGLQSTAALPPGASMWYHHLHDKEATFTGFAKCAGFTGLTVDCGSAPSCQDSTWMPLLALHCIDKQHKIQEIETPGVNIKLLTTKDLKPNIHN